MSNIFYVSSRGATATNWLSHVISLHPQIECYHGARNINVLPPPPSGEGDMFPADFCHKLEQYSNKWEKAVGSVHGYYSIDMKEPIELRGGTFMGMIRNPLFRTYSLYCHYKDRDDTELNPDLDTNLDVFKKLYEKTNVSYNEYVFGNLLCQFLAEDKCFMENLDHRHIIVMEKMVKDRDYFTGKIEMLTKNEIEISDDYLDKVFKAGKKNRHAKKSSTTCEEIYDKLSNEMVMVFFKIIKLLSGKTGISRYSKFGYKIDFPQRPLVINSKNIDIAYLINS